MSHADDLDEHLARTMPLIGFLEARLDEDRLLAAWSPRRRAIVPIYQVRSTREVIDTFHELVRDYREFEHQHFPGAGLFRGFSMFMIRYTEWVLRRAGREYRHHPDYCTGWW